MRLPKVALRVTLAVLTASACQFSEARYLDRQVTAKELQGTWTITETGKAGLKSVGRTTHLASNENQIVINSDGSCSYQGWRNPIANNGPTSDYVSMNCRWSLEVGSHQSILLEMAEPTARLRFFFAEENGRIILWQYLGDPDSWRYLEFSIQK